MYANNKQWIERQVAKNKNIQVLILYFICTCKNSQSILQFEESEQILEYQELICFNYFPSGTVLLENIGLLLSEFIIFIAVSEAMLSYN